MRLVGTAGTFDAGLALLNRSLATIDVVVLDVQLAGGAEGLRLLSVIADLAGGHAARPAVVMLSAFDQPSLVRAAFERGAAAMSSRPQDIPEIIAIGLATSLILIATAVDRLLGAAPARVALAAAGWPLVVAIVCIGAVVATATAIGYAVARPRRLDTWCSPRGARRLLRHRARSASGSWRRSAQTVLWLSLSIGDLALLTRSLIDGVLVFTPSDRLGSESGRAPDQGSAADRSTSTGTTAAVDRTAAAARIFVDELTPGGRRARLVADEDGRTFASTQAGSSWMTSRP